MLNISPKLKAAILSITTVFIEFIGVIKQGYTVDAPESIMHDVFVEYTGILLNIICIDPFCDNPNWAVTLNKSDTFFAETILDEDCTTYDKV